MGVKVASILHRERDQDVETPMYSSDGLRGGTINLEISVFGMFCCIDGD